MDLAQMQQKATAVDDLYNTLNLQQRGRAWTTQEVALGFVGDVGDLAKLVMADAGTRDIDNHRELLGHELADCLWSVLVLAERSGVDLGAEFEKCMAGLTDHIQTSLA